MPYVPPWEDVSPQAVLNAAGASGSAGVASQRTRTEAQQHALDTLLQSQESQNNQRLAAAKLQQDQQQFQQGLQMQGATLAIQKADADRNYQLKVQEQAQSNELAKQTMQLKAQDAARSYQWQQGVQNRVKQLMSPTDVTSADTAAAGIAGATSPEAGQGMDYTQALAQSLAESGPQPGESMAGFGTTMRALAPPNYPPVQEYVSPSSGKVVGHIYGGTFYNAPQPKGQQTDEDEAKNQLAESKEKAGYIASVMKDASTDPVLMGLSRDRVYEMASSEWDRIRGGKQAATQPGGEGGQVQGDLGFARLSSGNQAKIATPPGAGTGAVTQPGAPAASPETPDYKGMALSRRALDKQIANAQKEVQATQNATNMPPRVRAVQLQGQMKVLQQLQAERESLGQ